MDWLILGTIMFTLIFLIRFGSYLYFKKKKKKTKKRKKELPMEMMYLINKFDIDRKKIDNTHIAAIMSLEDALIITVAAIISTSITKIIFIEMIIGLVLVVIMIYGFNEILGKILLKKGYGKNEL